MKVSTIEEDGEAALKALAHLRPRRISLRLRLRSEDSPPRNNLSAAAESALPRGLRHNHVDKFHLLR